MYFQNETFDAFFWHFPAQTADIHPCSRRTTSMFTKTKSSLTVLGQRRGNSVFFISFETQITQTNITCRGHE